MINLRTLKRSIIQFLGFTKRFSQFLSKEHIFAFLKITSVPDIRLLSLITIWGKCEVLSWIVWLEKKKCNDKVPTGAYPSVFNKANDLAYLKQGVSPLDLTPCRLEKLSNVV